MGNLSEVWFLLPKGKKQEEKQTFILTKRLNLPLLPFSVSCFVHTHIQKLFRVKKLYFTDTY